MVNGKHVKYNVTLEELKNHIEYDAENGTFSRKKDGKVYNTVRKDDGYIVIQLNLAYRTTTSYKAHMLVWLFETGRWPDLQIDHINGIRHDNRFINLREVTQIQNSQNVSNLGKGSSGLRGVRYHNNKKRPYSATITINGNKKYLGSYFTPEEAHSAYVHAKLKYHDFNDRISTDNLVEVNKAIPRFKIDGTVDFLCRWCEDNNPDNFNVRRTRSVCIRCTRKIRSEQSKKRKEKKH